VKVFGSDKSNLSGLSGCAYDLNMGRAAGEKVVQGGSVSKAPNRAVSIMYKHHSNSLRSDMS
jgi:hypothetical protein